VIDNPGVWRSVFKLFINRVYTNEWWGFVSGLVKTDSHCTLYSCLFDSPTQGVFIHGTTVVDFINLKKVFCKRITKLQYVSHYPQDARSFFLIGAHHNTTLQIETLLFNKTM
jgi:hypothetical protein